MKSILPTETRLVDILQRRFQMHNLPAAARLESIDGSKLILSAIAIICGILFALFIWASLSSMEIIAVSNGELVPKGQATVLQHLEGGIVTQIYIKDGDEVVPGQLLMKLDPTAAMAELNQMQNHAAELINGNKTTTKNTANNFSGQLETLNKQLALQKKELAMYTNLVNTGAVSMRDYLVEQRTLNQILGQIDYTKAEFLQTQNSIQKLEDKVNRLTIRSPIHAIVQGLHSHVGSVLQPGAIIMELIPLDQELVVESKIPTTDIGHVKVGDPVKVKIHTYEYTRYGVVTGTLTNISATTFMNEKNVPYYKGTVTLDRNYIGDDPNKNRLLPGMTAEVDINTGKQSILQYLFKPIQTALSSSFHER